MLKTKRHALLDKEHVVSLVRVGGIEPPSRPWQGRIIPLNYTRSVFEYTIKPRFLQRLSSYATKSKAMIQTL